MPQSVTLKKLKFKGSMKTYKTFLELTLKKRCPFHYRGLECKSRKSRNTWKVKKHLEVKKHIFQGKFGLGIWNVGGQRLIEFCQENTLVTANILF